jgi:hypothetical protein
VPIRHTMQTVEPVAADLEVARHVGITIGVPVLLVERDFLGHGDTAVYYRSARSTAGTATGFSSLFATGGAAPGRECGDRTVHD